MKKQLILFIFSIFHVVSSEMIYKPIENYMLQFPLNKGIDDSTNWNRFIKELEYRECSSTCEESIGFDTLIFW